MVDIACLPELEGAPHAAVFPGTEPKTVRLTLAAGESVPRHRHPGRDVLLYVVDGRLDLHLDDETHRLETDDLARFAGEREIAPEAVEDSVALVVLATRETA